MHNIDTLFIVLDYIFMHEILNYNRYKNQRPFENAAVLFVAAIKLLCYNRSICLNCNIYSRQITVSKTVLKSTFTPYI